MAGNRRDKKSGGRKEILLRYAVIIACILALAGGISWKLVDNTVVMAQHWNHRADSMMAVVDTIAPDRGDLLACDGTIIATNMLKYNLRIDYEVQRFARERYMLAIDSLSDSLATYFPHRTRAQWRKHLIKGPSSVYRRNYPILTNITYYQSQRIREWPFFKIHNSDKTGWKLEAYISSRYMVRDQKLTTRRLEKQLEIIEAEKANERENYMSNTRESSMSRRIDTLHLGLSVRERPPYHVTKEND